MSGHERFTDQEILHLRVLANAADPLQAEFRVPEQVNAAMKWAHETYAARQRVIREAATPTEKPDHE